MKILRIIGLFMLCHLFVSCRDVGENITSQVVLYSSIDAIYTNQLVKAFEEKSGIKVKVVSDTEAAKSTGLVNRLKLEKESPVCDVFLSGDPMRTECLVSRGLGNSVNVQGTAARYRMIIVNHERESSSLKRPQSVLDLSLPEYAKTSCLANPQFGTTSMHLAALFVQLGEQRTKQFLTDFVKNGGRVLASNGEVKRRVGSGEFIYGLTDSDDVSVALLDGKPVDFVLPDRDTWGAVTIPMTVMKVTGAPNPEAAKSLAIFLNSVKAEKIMADGPASHFSLLSPESHPSGFSFSSSEVKSLEIPHKKLAEALEKHRDWIDEWVAGL